MRHYLIKEDTSSWYLRCVSLQNRSWFLIDLEKKLNVIVQTGLKAHYFKESISFVLAVHLSSRVISFTYKIIYSFIIWYCYCDSYFVWYFWFNHQLADLNSGESSFILCNKTTLFHFLYHSKLWKEIILCWNVHFVYVWYIHQYYERRIYNHSMILQH